MSTPAELFAVFQLGWEAAEVPDTPQRNPYAPHSKFWDAWNTGQRKCFIHLDNISKPTTHRAYLRGWAAAVDARIPDDNPYEISSEAYFAWDRGRTMYSTTAPCDPEQFK